MVPEDNERILRRAIAMKKAILYINQFFGQIGGEEKAGIEPEIIRKVRLDQQCSLKKS